jgi:hypothetical protein
MRLRMTMLAVLAMVATVSPARADLVFEYRLVPTIGTQTPGAPIVGPLVLTQGAPDVFLQLLLRDTGPNVGPVSPTNPTILPYDAGGGGTGDQLFAWGFRINFAQNAALQGIGYTPQPINGAVNSRTGLTSFGFTNPVITAGSDTAPAPAFAVLRNLTLGDGAYDPTNLYPLVNIRIHADGVNAGTGQFSIVDSGTSDDIGTNNNPSFDAGVFDQPFVLPVTVTAVPEPSSMVLLGLAVAGLGYRARRKKTAEVAV